MAGEFTGESASADALEAALAEHRAAPAPPGADDDLSPVAMARRMREEGTDRARERMFAAFARNLWAQYFDLLLAEVRGGAAAAGADPADGEEKGADAARAESDSRRRSALGDLEFYLGRPPEAADALAFLRVAAVPDSVARLVAADVARLLSPAPPEK